MNLDQIRARVAEITADWNANNDDEKTHGEIDQLQLEVLTAIAQAPNRITKAELKDMARVMLNLETLDLDRGKA